MVRKLIVIILLGIAALFWAMFYLQYYQWRDCFNELGRCYDSASGVVYLEQSGMIWGSAGLVFLISAVVIWLRGKAR